MGMYTQIETDFIIPWEGTEGIRAILMGMLHLAPMRQGVEYQPHPFFSTARWGMLLRGASAYFDRPCFTMHDDEWFPLGLGTRIIRDLNDLKEAGQGIRGLRIQSQSNIKDSGEIALFADWIRPYCLDQVDPIVISTYEEYPDSPTLYYKDGRVVP